MNIPIKIIQSKKLTLNEFGLIAMFYALADKNGKIYKNANELIKLLNCSKSSYYKYLNLLKDKGLITTCQPHENGRFQKSFIQLMEI